MTPEIMRQYLAAHAPELEVVELPGGKGHMMPGSEASKITGHSVGAITPLCSVPYCPYSSTLG